MKSSRVLEMLEKNRIEELKAELRDEIFTESLKKKPDAKKRYAAMKRYLSYVTSARSVLRKACEVEIDGSKYNAFCNSYSLALTKESTGELPLCDETDNYPDISRLISYDGKVGKIDIITAIATAKSGGYKLTKSAMYSNKYLLHYDGAYFRIGLLDLTYSVINDGRDAIVYHAEGSKRPITLTTDIGVAVVMPVHLDEVTDDSIVIEVAH